MFYFIIIAIIALIVFFPNFGLLLTALLLSAIAFPVGFIWTLIVAIKNRKMIRFGLYLNRTFKTIAISIDQLGNVVCKDFLNATFIIKDGFKFGHEDHTISMVLGINKQKGTLNKAGRFLADFLNFLDKNHVEKAIEKVCDLIVLWVLIHVLHTFLT